MASKQYEPPEGYVTMTEAATMLSTSRLTARARLKRAGVRVFQDTSDPRFRLVRRADVEAIAERRIIEVADEELRGVVEVSPDTQQAA